VVGLSDALGAAEAPRPAVAAGGCAGATMLVRRREVRRLSKTAWFGGRSTVTSSSSRIYRVWWEVEGTPAGGPHALCMSDSNKQENAARANVLQREDTMASAQMLMQAASSMTWSPFPQG